MEPLDSGLDSCSAHPALMEEACYFIPDSCLIKRFPPHPCMEASGLRLDPAPVNKNAHHFPVQN